jgi:hypothetical protein
VNINDSVQNRIDMVPEVKRIAHFPVPCDTENTNGGLAKQQAMLEPDFGV